MSRVGRGFALAVAMLIGALSLTSLLALGLQGHAVQQPAGDFSPTTDAIVDPSGWPREEKAPSEAPDTQRRDQGRSRLPPAEPGA